MLADCFLVDVGNEWTKIVNTRRREEKMKKKKKENGCKKLVADVLVIINFLYEEPMLRRGAHWIVQKLYVNFIRTVRIGN